jgi:streptogramin lyase
MRCLPRLTTLCCLIGLVPAAAAAGPAAAAPPAAAPAAAAPAAAPATAPAVTEFPVPQQGTDPLGIAPLSNGTLLFAQGARKGYAITTSSGSMFELPGLSGPAAGVVISDGYAWLTEPSAARIARIDMFGGVTEFKLPGKADPTGIAAGPDGNVWFTESGAPAGIGKITPSGIITQYSAGITPNSQPTGITAGPDGNLWFTEAGNPARIGKITPSGAVTQYTAGLTPHSQPTGITAGPDGNLWFTETANPGRIGRITPAGAITEYTTGLNPNSAPGAIAAGPAGDVWFTEAGNPGAIGWITPQGVISQVSTPTSDSAPAGLTEAPNGAVWFTEGGGQGRIGELTVPSPTAVTGPAVAVGATTATLTGTIDPNGFATTYQFDWGATTAYGQSLPAGDASAGSGSGPGPASQVLRGLTPNTTYHYRVVASNCGGCQPGTADGADMTFTTVAPTESNPTVASPVIGRTAVARVLAGTVYVRVPGSHTLQRLAAGRNIPLGSLIDARRGRLDVTTEISRHGRMQTAAVWAGRFVIGQTGSRGMTTFRLAGGPLDCPAHATGAIRAQAVRARHTTSISLWGEDDHGRYSTRGHNSVATVRGTEWKTVESCRGTLTFVRRGVVSVLDLHTHRTVLVHAGHSFLARP